MNIECSELMLYGRVIICAKPRAHAAIKTECNQLYFDLLEGVTFIEQYLFFYAECNALIIAYFVAFV